MSDQAQADPRLLPKGLKQRVAIASALAMKPRLIFLDEPAAGLNPKETIEVDHLVRKIADSGVTVVLVSPAMMVAVPLAALKSVPEVAESLLVA